jgi:hypothetical protein
MKKIIFAVLSVLFASSSAFAAAQSGDASNGLTIGATATTVVKGSKGVTVSYNGVQQGYILGTWHTSGTQTFATSAGDTKIFKATGTAVTLPTTIPTGSATADFGSSFTAL